jgi:hypothetical protein
LNITSTSSRTSSATKRSATKDSRRTTCSARRSSSWPICTCCASRCWPSDRRGLPDIHAWGDHEVKWPQLRHFYREWIALSRKIGLFSPPGTDSGIDHRDPKKPADETPAAGAGWLYCSSRAILKPRQRTATNLSQLQPL